MCFSTDHSNHVLVFVAEELSYLLFLSSSFLLRAAVELDLSAFSLDSLTLANCVEPYLVATDGSGRTVIYNCHTPAELIVPDGAAPVAGKGQASKPVQLDPILELERCPISTGPVTSDSRLAQRTDDPARKRPAKKKPAALPKGKARAKSPGTVAIETASTTETTRYHAVAYVFEQVAVLRFGVFPMVIVYSLAGSNPILNEFPLPSPVSTGLELPKENYVILGLENGSFCFLNVARRTLHDHHFPRQGAIYSLLMDNDILFTFTATKTITAYQVQAFRVVDRLFSCSDDDIIESHSSTNTLLTFNQKSSDINIIQALSRKITWDGRDIVLFPNISVLNDVNCGYLGTIETPVNLKLLQTMWNKRFIALIYDDPVEYRPAAPDGAPSLAHAKRAAPPKPGGKAGQTASRKLKGSRSMKKLEYVKELEPEPNPAMKRQIISLVNLTDIVGMFRANHERIQNEKEKRRRLRSGRRTEPAAVRDPTPTE
jgi:hypothetical protein